MESDTWQTVLVVALVTNAVIGLAYRIYRRTQGGPRADVWGQAVLGALLASIAIAIALGVGWLRWAALGYAALFAFIAMPVWVLGVLLPLRPRAIDYTFTVVYWLVLVVVGVSALLA